MSVYISVYISVCPLFMSFFCVELIHAQSPSWIVDRGSGSPAATRPSYAWSLKNGGWVQSCVIRQARPSATRVIRQARPSATRPSYYTRGAPKTRGGCGASIAHASILLHAWSPKNEGWVQSVHCPCVEPSHGRVNAWMRGRVNRPIFNFFFF